MAVTSHQAALGQHDTEQDQHRDRSDVDHYLDDGQVLGIQEQVDQPHTEERQGQPDDATYDLLGPQRPPARP